MKWAVAPDDTRTQAHPDLTGTCPACQAPVYPKCGDEIEWHWAHKIGDGVDCELGEGIDSDEYTGWHIAIQTYAQAEGATVEATHPTKKRRADIRTPAGLVIELQHSRIDPAVLHGREDDWLPEGPMIWLWDAAQWARMGTWDAGRTVGTRLPAKPLVIGRTPIFLDRGDQVEQITAMAKKAGANAYEVLFGPVGWNIYQFIDRCITGRIPDEWLQAPVRMGAPAIHPQRHRQEYNPAAVTYPKPMPRPPPRPSYTRPAPSPNRFCSAPAFPGTFSGDRCGLTATDGSDLCWAHLEIRKAS